MGEKLETTHGTLFISTDDGKTFQPLGDIVAPVELQYADSEAEKYIESLSLTREETFEAELTPESTEALQQLEVQWQEYRRQLMQAVRWFMRAFAQVYTDKGIRRMVHLAKHARKARTRKKNVRRVVVTVMEVAEHD